MSRRKSKFRALVWILAVGLLSYRTPLLCQPQVLGSLSGTIVDAEGAVIPGAQIIATNEATGQTATAVTNSEGAYQFQSLVLGRYDLVVRRTGFQDLKATGILVSVETLSRSDFTMKVGAGTTGTVTSAGPGVTLTSRAFLLSDQREEPGYGLYSYILFGSPPNDATRELYRAVLADFLSLPTSQEAKKWTPLNQLNLTLIPIQGNEAPSTAEQLLASYDFPRAAALLTKISCQQGAVPCGPHLGGPYIVSTVLPLSQQASVSDHFLYQDLSSVPPRIVPLWIDEFQKQAAQKDFWKKRNGPQAALKARTAIALLGDSLTPTEQAAGDFKKALASIVWHK